MAKDKTPVTYVQELTVTSPIGIETVQTLDVAWHTMLDRAAQHGMPVMTKFVQLVRSE